MLNPSLHVVLSCEALWCFGPIRSFVLLFYFSFFLLTAPHKHCCEKTKHNKNEIAKEKEGPSLNPGIFNTGDGMLNAPGYC